MVSDVSPIDGSTDSCRKIAFVGTHGVGKTTLCFELAARLKRRGIRVDLVKEVARRCPLPLNQQTTMAAQAWILHTQIAEELALCPGHDVLICDRSAVDNYAYLVARFGRVEPYDSVVADWIRTYALLVWVPPVDAPSFDGVRDTDLRYQREIDRTLHELIEAFALTPLRLDPTRRDSWIEDVVAALPRTAEQLGLFDPDEPPSR